MSRVNAAVATNIMGWQEVTEGYYQDPKQRDGVLTTLPDFILKLHDHKCLQQKMTSHGWKLNMTNAPADFEKNVGQMFTASWRRGDESFETTTSFDREAVCLAALKTCGVQLCSNE